MKSEAIERGWVCPDNREHYWVKQIVGSIVVDEECERCGLMKSEL